MPRVRIHLNLKNPQNAESSIKLQQGGKSEHWPTVAYADHIILRDVVPVVDTSKHRSIVEGGIKRPMAFLEGELVAWSGRLRPAEGLQHGDQLRRQQAEILPHQSTPETMHPAVADIFQDPGYVQYNPKKSQLFYWGALGSAPEKAFVSSAEVAAVGWCFKARNVQTQPLPPGMRVTQPTRQTETERQDIPKGIATTQALLASHGFGGR